MDSLGQNKPGSAAASPVKSPVTEERMIAAHAAFETAALLWIVVSVARGRALVFAREGRKSCK
jgi:hypothetical protein